MHYEQDEDRDSGAGNGGFSGSRTEYGGPEPERAVWSGARQEKEEETGPSRQDYADATYVPVRETTGFRPGHYNYETEKSRKKAGDFNLGRLIALCLVCALLGGFAGAGVGVSVMYLRESEPSANSPGAPGPTPANLPLASSVGTGGVLTGSEIFEMSCPMVVCINVEMVVQSFFGPVPASSSGTGFIIRSDGYIVTNYHVIEDAIEGGFDIDVTLYSGETYKASVAGYDKDNDVAVIKINADGLPAVTLGDSSLMKVGEPVYTIGNPMGVLSYTITSGVLSAVDRQISTDNNETINTLQIDAAVNEGNSGGPVFNTRGEVIGIVTAKFKATGIEGLGFAIPINDAISIMNDLIEKGYVSGKPSLDVSVQTIDRAAAQYYHLVQGSYIFILDEGGAADLAGLIAGDIITQVNDAEVLTSDALKAELKKYAAGDSVKITAVRSGETITVNVTLSEAKPDLPADSRNSGAGQQQTWIR